MMKKYVLGLNLLLITFILNLNAGFSESVIMNQTQKAWIAMGTLSSDHAIDLTYWDGQDWHEHFKTPPLDQKHNFSPYIALDKQGLPWMVWVGETQLNSAIFASYFNGDHWSQPLQVSAFNDQEKTFPSLSIDDQGFLHVVWTQSTVDGDEIFYSRFNGTLFLDPIQVNEADQWPDLQPSVSVSGDQTLFVWSGFDGYGYRLYSRLLKKDQWSHEIPLMTGEQRPSQEHPWIEKQGNHWKIYFLNQSKASFVQFDGEKYGSIISENWVLDNVDMIQKLNQWPHAQSSLAWVTHQESLHMRYVFFEQPSDSISSRSLISYKTNSKKSQFWNINSQLWAEIVADVYILFGDSLASNSYGLPPQLNAVIMNTYGVGIVNSQGNPGEKSNEGLSRIGKVLSKNDGEVFILLEGTNDIADGVSATTVANNLLNIVNAAIGQGLKVVISTVPPRQDIFNDRARRLNDEIRSLASANGLALAEVYYAVDAKENKESLYVDHLHFNSEGNLVVAEAMLQAIKTYKKAPGSGGGCHVGPVSSDPFSGVNINLEFLLLAMIVIALMRRKLALSK